MQTLRPAPGIGHWLRGEGFYVTLLVASILITRLVLLLFFAPEFWLDEAMLGVNVRDVPYSDFF